MKRKEHDLPNLQIFGGSILVFWGETISIICQPSKATSNPNWASPTTLSQVIGNVHIRCLIHWSGTNGGEPLSGSGERSKIVGWKIHNLYIYSFRWYGVWNFESCVGKGGGPAIYQLVSLIPRISNIGISIYLEHKWPLFWLGKALFWGVDLQK